MNRRELLASAGTVLSLGALGRTAGRPTDTLVVRVWRSEQAAAYDGVRSTVREYLTAALDPVVGGVEVQFAERTVSLPREGGRAVLANLWPRIVLAGVTGVRDVDPVDGVNLLVTDGDPTVQPAGYGRPTVAAVTGAAKLADAPPAAETSGVVPYSVTNAVVQLVLHECGHALGLSHDHGSASVDGERVVASPMVGSYLWESGRSDHLDSSGNQCGESYPDPDDGERRSLGLRYGPCARSALRGSPTARA